MIVSKCIRCTIKAQSVRKAIPIRVFGRKGFRRRGFGRRGFRINRLKIRFRISRFGRSFTVYYY